MLGAILTMLAAPAPRAVAQSPEDLEAKVKSAFLLNFARYVEWPPGAFAQPTSPVVIGVLGQDLLGRNLDTTVEGKMVESHPVQVKRGRRLADIGTCHVLFVCPSERDRVRTIATALEGKPVLLVSDMEDFTQLGGMIQLKKTRLGTMRFEIDKAAADRAGLKISSKLLRLAENLRQP